MLTLRRRELLKLIASYEARNAPAFLSQLAADMHLARESSVRSILDPLIASGYVERRRLGPGNLPSVPYLTERGRLALNNGGALPAPDGPATDEEERLWPGVPMYGPLHAGACGVQFDEPVRYIQKLADLFPLSNGEYFTPVTGNCMAGGDPSCGETPIQAGDVALMRPASRLDRPANGEIAHVEPPLGSGESEPLIREYRFNEAAGTVTLKCYSPLPGEPAEVTYADEDVEPRGVLVAVIHNVSKGKGRKK
jgi:hypothetical protein